MKKYEKSHSIIREVKIVMVKRAVEMTVTEHLRQSRGKEDSCSF